MRKVLLLLIGLIASGCSKKEDKEEELWNLATDIHVEYVLDSMDIELLSRPAYPFRENYFQKLEKEQ